MHILAILTRRCARALAAGTLTLCLLPGISAAQNLFAPAVRVNDTAITKYEVNQRELLLSVLRTPGDVPKLALNNLINERLQLTAANRADITVDDAELTAGIEEFAGRANLTGEEFISVLNSAGVATESFRDFVVAGLAWRELVQARFGPKSSISDGEVNRAIERAFEQAGDRASVRVLISEIYLAANTPAAKAASERLATQIVKATSVSSFSAAARQYSVGPSAQRGGRVETWVSLANLPPAIGTAFLTMKPGDVTNPFPLPQALVIFQLRAIEETDAPARTNVEIDYASYFIPGARSGGAHTTAEKIRARVDVCDDLYAVARGQPEDVLQRETRPVADISRDVALELAKLDVGEVSTALTRADSDAVVFLMLCARKSVDADAVEPEPNAIRQQLLNQRLASYANAYLAELKADAIITYP